MIFCSTLPHFSPETLSETDYADHGTFMKMVLINGYLSYRNSPLNKDNTFVGDSTIFNSLIAPTF